ncbi:hypothetical protein QTG56_24830 (plasmid) [Rossellomorea sp. AcN35-11]|nr:hypothetical protein [Rossellomorea aquimaris]WJV31861.1 hypothetical protein QTG56_24830 [Rossellomorea sp. AcN35-11]
MTELILNKDLIWSSDWCGEEIGYEHISIVGLYLTRETEIQFYIDMDSLEILEAWTFDEDDQEIRYDPLMYCVNY